MRAKSAAEAVAVKKKEAELAVLDAKIAELKGKMGQAGGGGGSTLDQLVAVVDQRETQAKELEAMRQQADAERQAREAEIARLKEAERTQKQTDLDADIAKYERVAKSDYGQDLKTNAWDALLERWGIQKGSVKEGDYRKLTRLLGLVPPAPAVPDTMVFVEGGAFDMGSD